ncbi:hypothetical protein DFS33DRAFT_941844 [Desarmillaria ectypa]|nr:hypothetical protein DFS33DRAFT_941844 [Desarmillaria ectypa]
MGCGMSGGSRRTRNFWLRREAAGSVTIIALGGKNERPMKVGDRIRISKSACLRCMLLTSTETPGGSGYGGPGSAQDASQLYGTYPLSCEWKFSRCEELRTVIEY